MRSLAVDYRRLPFAAVFVLVLSPVPGLAQTIDPAARAAILEAQRAQAAVSGYGVNAVSVDLVRGHSTLPGRMVHVRPDRYHYSDSESQTIAIGARSWIRGAQGRWELVDFDASRLMRNLSGPFRIDEDGYQLREARALGSGEHPREKTRRYEYVVANEEAQETMRVKVWVSVGPGLPIKYQAEHTLGRDRSRVTWDIDYDKKYRVDPPAGRYHP